MKSILLFALLFLLAVKPVVVCAQVYADSQTNTANGLCIGCGMTNAPYSTDGNLTSYSTMYLTVAVLGANASQKMKFSTAGNAGEVVGVVIEDVNGQPLDAALLSAISLTSYSNSVSNADTKSSSSFVWNKVPGSASKYYVEFATTTNFNTVELKLSAGIIGALTGVRIYYGYHTVSTLPIKLLDFYGTANEEGIDIKWSTASEVDNDYFTIEESTNALDFEPVAKIPSKGNSGAIEYYQISVKPSQSGVVYYRLKQTDFDDTFTYSAPISFEYTALQQAENNFLYPNPNNGSFVVNYAMAEGDEGKFVICNMSGEKLVEYPLDPFTHQLAIDNSFLDKGMYHAFFIINGNIKTSTKLVLK